MGLDIYLVTKEKNARDEAREKVWDALWERVKDLPEEERQAKIQEAKDAGEYTDYEANPDVASEKYPDHICNRRYLRSSYNQGGFNSAVPDFTGQDHGYYWIFEPLGADLEEYEHVLTERTLPLLAACRDRALQVAEELRGCDLLRVDSVGMMIGDSEHMWHEPPTEAQVLDWYRNEVRNNEARAKENKTPFNDGGYSNAKGHVMGFKQGMEVLGCTVGKDILGRPAAILVYRASSETVDHYVASAEIAAEFCEEAAELVKRDGEAYMHWSG